MMVIVFLNTFACNHSNTMATFSLFLLSFGAGDDGSVRAPEFSGGRETEASSTGKKTHTLWHIKN